MKELIACPNCGSSFNVSREVEGKRARCPRCGETFRVHFDAADAIRADEDYLDLPPPQTPHEGSAFADWDEILSSRAPQRVRSAANVPPPQPRTKPAPRPVRSSEVAAAASWYLFVLPAVATLIVGYFLGRAHVGYQLRSSLGDVGELFAEQLHAIDTPGFDEPPVAIDEPREVDEPRAFDELLAFGEPPGQADPAGFDEPPDRDGFQWRGEPVWRGQPAGRGPSEEPDTPPGGRDSRGLAEAREALRDPGFGSDRPRPGEPNMDFGPRGATPNPFAMAMGQPPGKTHLTLGQTYVGNGYMVTLAEARIGRPKLRRLGGMTRELNDSKLLLRLDIRNADPRKTLRYEPERKFLAKRCRLVDDEGRPINDLNLFMEEPVDGPESGEDIPPGESGSQLLVYNLPRPTADELKLTLDLGVFLDFGEVEWMIPESEIQR